MSRNIVLISAMLLISSTGIYAQEKQVYNALASDNLVTIEKQIKVLGNPKTESGAAYLGTLLMKKAGLIKGPGKKLKVFKEGREKLEDAINGNKENGEYRFLRLMIQENAPGILGYNKEIKADAALVKQKYADLDPGVKNAIKDYSRKSRNLKDLE